MTADVYRFVNFTVILACAFSGIHELDIIHIPGTGGGMEVLAKSLHIAQAFNPRIR